MQPDYQIAQARRNRVISRFTMPTTERGMRSLRQHIEIAIDTRKTLARTQPTYQPIADDALLGIALAGWLGGDPKDVVAAVRQVMEA